MFNTAMHAEFLTDMKDFGFDVTVNGFDWRLGFLIIYFGIIRLMLIQ